MPVIELELRISAPADRVFDLSRSVDLHMRSTARTQERVVAGKTTGLLSLHDEVTWEAVHFGLRQRLTSRIVTFDRPRHFRDVMVQGAFRRFDHDHFFKADSTGTLIRDRLDFDSPFGPLGHLANALVLRRYMQRFLEERLDVLKRVAESEEWPRYLAAG